MSSKDKVSKLKLKKLLGDSEKDKRAKIRASISKKICNLTGVDIVKQKLSSDKLTLDFELTSDFDLNFGFLTLCFKLERSGL